MSILTLVFGYMDLCCQLARLVKPHLMEMNQQNKCVMMSLTISLKAVSLHHVAKGIAPVIVSELISVDIATIVCCPREF